MELGHCVRVHSGNLLGRCHQLIRRRRHGVGGRDFSLQDKGSSDPLEPKWWPKWILIKSQDKRPPAVNALAQTLQSTTLVQQKEPYSQNGASFMPQRVSAKMGGLPSSTGQLPSAADGSRIDAIPNGRIASAANTNGRAGRWGGLPSPHAVGSRCRISGPSAPVRAATRLWGVPRRASQGPRHLRPLPLPSCLEARGESVSGPSAPALSTPHSISGRTIASFHALVSVRGEGDGGLGVLCCIGLHGHPRVRESEMPETSGAPQVHLRLRMEVLLRQLRNLEPL